MFTQTILIIALITTALNVSADSNQNNGVMQQLNILQAEIAVLKAQQIPETLTLNVDCNNNESLMDALAMPAKDLHIHFSGNSIG